MGYLINLVKLGCDRYEQEWMLHFQGLVLKVGLGDRWGLSSKRTHQSTQSSGVFKVELREDESSSQLVMENAEVFCYRWNYLLDGGR